MNDPNKAWESYSKRHFLAVALTLLAVVFAYLLGEYYYGQSLNEASYLKQRLNEVSSKIDVLKFEDFRSTLKLYEELGHSRVKQSVVLIELCNLYGQLTDEQKREVSKELPDIMNECPGILEEFQVRQRE